MPRHSKPDSTGPTRYGSSQSTAGDARGAAALALTTAELLRETVTAVLNAGDAILIGTTRDGGAVAIQLFSGDRVDRLYAATLEELQETLQGVLLAAESAIS
jgi:hypothetical protein